MAYSTSLDTDNNLVTLDQVKERVGVDPGVEEVVTIACPPADADGGIDTTYFLISSTVDDYYVWFNVSVGPLP